MIGMRVRGAMWTALAAAGLMLTAGAARASQAPIDQFAPNYTFADGAKGFALVTSGGPISPGVIVGFNPQPDPPGRGLDDGAHISLLNPEDPILFSPAAGGSFSFLIGLLMPGDGSVLPLPDAPNADGHTSARYLIDDHVVEIGLAFSGPGAIDPGSWVGFNPQPDPPGDVLGGAFSFTARGDPLMGMTISIDGQTLDFAMKPGVPEPSAWALMLAGFGGIGAMLRTRRRMVQAAA